MIEHTFSRQPARALNINGGGVKGAGVVQDFVLQPSVECTFRVPRLSRGRAQNWSVIKLVTHLEAPSGLDFRVTRLFRGVLQSWTLI